MSENLATIKGLPGVMGVALFDENGGCVDHALDSPYDPRLIGEVYRNLRIGLEPFRAVSGGSLATVLARTSDGVLGVHHFDDLAGFVVGTPALNPTMLTVAFKSVALNYRDAAAATADAEAEASTESPIQPIVNPLSPDHLRRTLAAFMRQLGPFAELIWKDELTALSGNPSTVDQSQFSQLVRRLAGKIEQTEKRQEFLAEVNTLGDF